MTGDSFEEKREFLRCKYDKPISYKVISSAGQGSPGSRALDAVARNLSASGVLFSSRYHPEISSIIALDMDYRTARICQEIEENALIVNNKIVGKVVRIEEDKDGLYGVGVAFIKRLSRLPKDLEKMMI
jgi:hypothetical protein